MCLYIPLFLMLAVQCAVILSCSAPDAGTRSGEILQTEYDDLDREVSLWGVPQRIVSLAPNATEILFAIGAGDRVVGVTDYCNYPPEAKDIAKVGSFSILNIERILSIAPDFVVLSSHEQERFIKILEDLDIPVYVCFPRNFQELFRSIEAMGKLTGTFDRSSLLVDSLESELDRLKEDVEEAFDDDERLRIYLEISSRPLMTVGENSFIGNLIEVSGGENIGHGIPRDYAVISPELIISRNPDIIFIFQSSSSRENLMKRLGWDRINAVRTGMIFDNLDEDRVLRPGPRSIQGAREIFDHLLSAKEAYGQGLDRK